MRPEDAGAELSGEVRGDGGLWVEGDEEGVWITARDVHRAVRQEEGGGVVHAVHSLILRHLEEPGISWEGIREG